MKVAFKILLFLFISHQIELIYVKGEERCLDSECSGNIPMKQSAQSRLEARHEERLRRELDFSDIPLVLAGESLVYENEPVYIFGPLGSLILKRLSETEYQGHFSLSSDLDFSMQRASGNEWKLKMSGGSLVSGIPEEDAIESMLQEKFFHDGSLISITPKYSILRYQRAGWLLSVKEGGLTSSIIASPYDALGEPKQGIEGLWLEGNLTLKIGQIDRVRYACKLSGINNHQFFLIRQNARSAYVTEMKSTSLEFFDEAAKQHEQEVVEALIRTLEVTLDPEDHRSLTFTSQLNPPVSFTRASYSDGHHPSRNSRPTFWEWMPETLLTNSTVGSAEKLIQTYGNMKVVAELRHPRGADLIIFYCAGLPCLQFMRLPTGSRKILTSVTNIGPIEDSMKELVAGMKSMMSQVEVLDIDEENGFLTVLGSRSSISFSSIRQPSEGVWLLDPRYSSKMIAVPSAFRHVSFLVYRRGNILRGRIQGATLVFDCLIKNENITLGSEMWTLEKEGVQKGVSQADKELFEFLDAPGLILKVAQSNSIEALQLRHPREGDFIFVHPKTLTAALVGDWKIASKQEGNVQLDLSVREGLVLNLRAHGVGSLHGIFRYKRGYVNHIELTEDVLALEGNPLEMLPSRAEDAYATSWNIEVNEAPRHAIFHKALGPDEGFEQDEFVDVLNECNRLVVVERGTKLYAMTKNGKSIIFKKILKRSIEHKVYGTWGVQLIIVDSIASDSEGLNEEAVDVVINRSPNPIISLTFSASNVTYTPTNEGSEAILWDPETVRMFNVKVESESGFHTATILLAINPWGKVQVQNIDSEGVNKSEEERKIAETLLNFFSPEENIQLVQADRSQLMFATESSILGLSRVIPAFPPIVIYTASIVCQGEECDQKGPRDPKAGTTDKALKTPTLKTTSKGLKAATVDAANETELKSLNRTAAISSVNMMKVVRRRLEAMELLQRSVDRAQVFQGPKNH